MYFENKAKFAFNWKHSKNSVPFSKKGIQNQINQAQKLKFVLVIEFLTS